MHSGIMYRGRICIYFRYLNLIMTDGQALWVCPLTLIEHKNVNIFLHISRLSGIHILFS